MTTLVTYLREVHVVVVERDRGLDERGDDEAPAEVELPADEGEPEELVLHYL